MNVWKRAKQIFIPFIVCGILLTMIMAGYGNILGYPTSSSELWNEILNNLTNKAFQYPVLNDRVYSTVDNGWYFLMATFSGILIYYAIADVALKNWKRTVIAVMILLLIAALINGITTMRLPFRFELAPVAASFMLAGGFMKKHNVIPFLEEKWKTKKFWFILMPIAAIGILFAYFFPTGMNMSMNSFGEHDPWSVFTFFVVSTACGCTLLALMAMVSKIHPLVKVFSIASKYSLHILLMHAFYIKIISAPFYGIECNFFFPTMPIYVQIPTAIAAIILSILTEYIAHHINEYMKKRIIVLKTRKIVSSV